MSNFYGILAPAWARPRDIVNKLHDDIVTAINSPDVQKTLVFGSSLRSRRQQSG